MKKRRARESLKPPCQMVETLTLNPASMDVTRGNQEIKPCSDVTARSGGAGAETALTKPPTVTAGPARMSEDDRRQYQTF